MNLAELAESAVERLGERVTLIFDNKKYTNLQGLDNSRRLQGALNRLGLGPGDFAAMCMINNPMVFSIFGGIFRTGAVAVPVMFLLAEPELRYILTDTKTQGVFTDPLSLDKVRQAAAGLDHVKWIVVVGGPADPNRSIPEYTLDQLLEEPPMETLPPIQDDDTALVLYTSGTTGAPKGAMLTHANLVASAEAANLAAELDSWHDPYITLIALPMAHIFGVGVMNTGHLTPLHLATPLEWSCPGSTPTHSLN